MCDGFPRLDFFEDLICDWDVLAYTEVAALQVISNIDRRLTAEPNSIFNSILGAVTKNPAQHDEDLTFTELFRSFMNICEHRNDYSFMCSTKRNERTGEIWRPKPHVLYATLVW